MKKSRWSFSVVALLGAVAAQPSLAADMPMPRKAAPIVPAPVYSWAGLYGGIHAGYGWDPASATFSPDDYGRALVPGLVAGPTPPINLEAKPSGWLGGLQASYNWQSGGLVYGLEADASISRLKDEKTGAFDVAASSSGDNSSFSGNVRLKQEVDYFGTVRGRLGLASNTLLLFGTGGLSWGRVKTTYETYNLASPGNGAGTEAVLTTPHSATSDKTRFGFAVGGGAEWAFLPRWSLKAEYLYIKFGGNETLALPGNSATTEFHMHLARAGLNYKFTP